jgi:cytosine deaminase
LGPVSIALPIRWVSYTSCFNRSRREFDAHQPCLKNIDLFCRDVLPHLEVGEIPEWGRNHPADASGIPVAIAGDNCRDPFHAYGDHDMVDTFRQAVRILHLDHPFADASAMAGPVPQAIIRAGQLGTIAKGGPARLILFNARTLNELICRPQSDRLVIDRGRRVSAELPDDGELDGD